MNQLREIQQDLNAPKDKFNSFGGYSYRSAESILEAVKPHLKKHKLTLILTDEVICIGEKNYIKSTAKLYFGIEPHAEASAFAREAVTKKGMDDAQITGSASSYARKYALNGLFAIDDTKDPDTNEHRQERTEKPSDEGIAKAKQKLWSEFKEKNITDSAEMMEKIQSAIGKDTVETIGDVAKVIKSLNE